MIPADIVTGHLKVGNDIQTSLSSAVSSYEIVPFGAGDYTVGVQTIDQSYAGSKFNICSLSDVKPSGIDNVLTDNGGTHLQIHVNELSLDVEGEEGIRFDVYGIDGVLVAWDYAPNTVKLPKAGIYIVSVQRENGVYSEKIAVR